jgi:hypothetical protein
MSLDFSKFNLPADANISELEKRQSIQVVDGVTRYSGHDAYGLGFRFFVFDNYNEAKSKAARCELFDPLEMIEVFIDRKTRLHKRVDDKIRHKYAEEYRRFKEGLEAPGTPLHKWGVMPSHEIQTLVKDGIFTVEQFAIQAADKVQGRYPAVFFEHFTRAQQFVASKTGVVDAAAMADKMVELQKQYAEMQAQLLALSEENKILASGSKPKKTSRGRPKKIIVTDADFE